MMLPNTYNAPDSGTTSGSRQTLVTGEACRRACEKLKEELAYKTLEELEGQEYLGEYLARTDAMGSDVKNPVSHVAYGYATQVCILDKNGRIEKIVAATTWDGSESSFCRRPDRGRSAHVHRLCSHRASMD